MHNAITLHPLGLYADQSTNEDSEDFIIPEDLTTLSDEELTALHTQAVENFNSLYGDGEELSDEDMQALTSLTDGIETLQSEVTVRQEAASQRAEQAAALASRVRGEEAEEDAESEEDEDAEDDEDDEATAEADEESEDEESAAETVTASGRAVRVPLSQVRKRAQRRPRKEAEPSRTMADIVSSTAEGVTGYAVGQGLNWDQVGDIVNRRLGQFNQGQYENAARSGKHLRQQGGVLAIKRPTEFRLDSNDPHLVEEILRKAGDEARLPGNSLVAAGGWCAPSETIYDLCELEGRDGLFSLPEITVTRGGISRTLGPDFADIYNDAGAGWSYTEAEDIAGDYDGEGGGEKPCYRIDCPDFEEFRLEVAGLCLTAGLLQQRGYPEVIARTVRGALVAHDHKMSGRRLAAIEDESTAVTMPSPQDGTAAPLLTAIGLQVEHMRYANRIPRARALEAVFPFWVLEAIRADMARRDGVDTLAVTDAQITSWFRSRGVNPQFVYNWQDITADPSEFTAWPETVKFLLYPAGTFVGAGSEILTLDTLYDSVLLGQNDFTALWTEESWMVVKMCHDSRVVEVPVCSSGAVGARVGFNCDGTVGTAD